MRWERRAALVEWLEAMSPQCFYTTTFGKKWPEGPTSTAVRYHMDRFFEEHGDPFRFSVVERGWSGSRRWHGHGLILRGTLPVTRRYRELLWEDWGRRYGRSQFSEMEAIGGAEGYVAKYCTQGRYEDHWWLTGRR